MWRQSFCTTVIQETALPADAVVWQWHLPVHLPSSTLTWLDAAPAAVARCRPHERAAAGDGVAAACYPSGSHAHCQPALPQRAGGCRVARETWADQLQIRHTAPVPPQRLLEAGRSVCLDHSTASTNLRGCQQTLASRATGPQGQPGRRQTRGWGKLRQAQHSGGRHHNLWACSPPIVVHASTVHAVTCAACPHACGASSLPDSAPHALVKMRDASLPPRLCPLVASCSGSTTPYSGLAVSLAWAATHCTAEPGGQGLAAATMDAPLPSLRSFQPSVEGAQAASPRPAQGRVAPRPRWSLAAGMVCHTAGWQQRLWRWRAQLQGPAKWRNACEVGPVQGLRTCTTARPQLTSCFTMRWYHEALFCVRREETRRFKAARQGAGPWHVRLAASGGGGGGGSGLWIGDVGAPGRGSP